MAQIHDDVLSALKDLQSQELSIIKISEPISTAIRQATTAGASDVSQDAFDNPTPSSLEADLSHYKV